MKDIMDCLRHKLAVFVLWGRHDTGVSLYRVIMHDMDKLVVMCLCGDRLATKSHRRFASHHNIRCDADFAEAYLDWASARVTKPSKPLDAVATAVKWYPQYADKAIAWHGVVKYK